MWIDQRGSEVLTVPECHRLIAVGAEAGLTGRLGVASPGRGCRGIDRLARFGSTRIPLGTDAVDIEGGIGRTRHATSERGRVWDDIEVVGTLTPVRASDRTLDLDRTFEPVPALRAAGVTDFRLTLAAPAGFDAAVAYFGDETSAFRAAVR